MLCFYELHKKIDNGLGKLFERHGKCIARNPWKIVILVCFIDIGLGLGILTLKQESGIDQYVPTGTTAKTDQTMVNRLFKINTSVNFNIQSLSDLGQYGEVIIEMKSGDSIMNYSNWKHLNDLYAYINNISIEDTSGSIFLYSDLCARADGKCVVGGIGVDDMFILLSCLADTDCTESTENRIGMALKHGGTAITITSLTDIIAFCAGAASVFPSVRYFSWYTGCAVLFCYLNYVTLYIGIMTINEKRVSKNRHWLTCCKTEPRESLEADGKSRAHVVFCGGAPRTSRKEVEGPIEKCPKRLIKKIVSNTPAKVIITVFFVAYLVVLSWRASTFREDLDLRNLVSKDSYYYKFYDTNIKHFSQGFLVSFNVRSEIDYKSEFIVENINSVFKKADDDKDIFNNFHLCWLDSYMKSPEFDNTTLINFTLGLRKFLNTTYGTVFINDILINGNSIIASRFHIHSRSLIKSSDQAALMIRLRDIAKSSPLPVFVFSPNFIFYEQYVQIVPQTIQTLAIAVSVVFLVTAAFMPLPVLILLVTISVSMIMVGVIGLMEIWGLTLSSVTMIHIIMCVGFSVDFSAHICHAYAHSQDKDRQSKVTSALDMAGGPVLNGALSSFIGIIVLAFSQSYIFFSFFKVMSTVVVVGAIHALFLLPVLLSFIGPIYDTSENNSEKLNEKSFNDLSTKLGPLEKRKK